MSAEADVADDAFFEEAAAANLTLLREGEVVAGYQGSVTKRKVCFETTLW